MIIDCPNCNKKFFIDKKLIPENGRTLKCSSCDYIWHYKMPITKSIDDLGISEDKEIDLDTNISKLEKKEDEYNEKISNENLNNISQEVRSEENAEDEENEEDDIKDEKKQGKIKMILVYFIVVFVSLLALIFLLDTLKSYLSTVFPSITPLFDSFYETLLDLKLFIKDLAN